RRQVRRSWSSDGARQAERSGERILGSGWATLQPVAAPLLECSPVQAPFSEQWTASARAGEPFPATAAPKSLSPKYFRSSSAAPAALTRMARRLVLQCISGGDNTTPWFCLGDIPNPPSNGRAV